MDPRRRAKILEKIQSGRATRAERLILKQEGLCFYCWEDLEKDVTKEHLEALALGGANSKANLRVAHMRCNGLVGSLPVDVKLDLHEIGRDKGADAFWQAARAAQERLGKEKRAYTAPRSKWKPIRSEQLRNANSRPALEDTHDLSSGEAEVELEKMQLGTASQRRRLSRAEKLILYDEESKRRQSANAGPRMTWVEFFRMLDRMDARRAAAARLAACGQAA